MLKEVPTSIEQVVPGVHRVNLGIVNAYLLEDGEGLVLVDTGTPGSADRFLEAVRALGKSPADVNRILVTHLHADHTGSLAVLKKVTGAPAVMHPLDAEMVRKGETIRSVDPAPGFLNWVLVKLVMSRRGPSTIEPSAIEYEVEDSDRLDISGGLRVIHAPGHAAGQICFLWEKHGGLLFVGDAASNMMGLGYPPIFEDLQEGLVTLKKLGGLDFEVACFGHGKPIQHKAAKKFRSKWGLA